MATDKLVTAIVVSLSLGRLTQAGTGVWTTAGPYRETGSPTLVDPTTPSILYTHVVGYGLFKSTNAGTDWRPIGGLGSGVLALAIDPTNHAVLYAIQSGAFRKSTDSGDTWSSPHPGLPYTLGVIALNPTNSKVLYVVAGSSIPARLFKSADGGETWNVVGTGIPDPVQVLVLDPMNPATMYAGTTRGVSKSTDGGATWFLASVGLPPAATSVLAVDPVKPSTLFAGGYSGLFKSSDSGSSWTSINPMGVTALCIDPISPATLYAGTPGNGVYRSTDAGVTWASANTGLGGMGIGGLALSATTPTTIYVATDMGVFRSADAGGSWLIASTGLPGRDLSAVASARTDPAVAYAEDPGEPKLYRTSDFGGNWTSSRRLPFGGCFVVDPTDSATLIATDTYCPPWGPVPSNPLVCYQNAIKSTDAGATWDALGLIYFGPPTSITALAIDQQTASTIYAGAGDGRFFRSNDAGRTWTPAPTGLAAILCLAIAADNPANVYAGGTTGVLRSTDGGDTWFGPGLGIALSPSVNALAIDPASPSTLYAGTDTLGVFKSTDSGTTWVAANTGLPASISTLAIHPTMPSLLYAGTRENGVYRSTNAGASWSPVNKGLAALTVHGLDIDPRTGRVYAATREGVWQSTPPAGADADLVLTLTDAPDPVTGTRPLTYTIAVADNGPGPAGPLMFSQTLPAGVIFDHAGGPGWNCTEANGIVECTHPGLDVGSVAPLSVQVTPGPASAVLTSAATVSAAELDPNPANNSASEATTVRQALVWFGTRTKTAQAPSGRYVVNGDVTYTITLSNSGTQAQVDSAGDEFNDALPSTLSLLSASATTGAVSVDLFGNSVAWNGTIPSGASVVITVHAAIRPRVALDTVVSNQGVIHYDADGDGTAEATTVTDDPDQPGANDATRLVVVSPPLHLSTLTPCRLIDTRDAHGAFGGPALAANAERTLILFDRCGIPTSARAVSVNVTVTGPTAAGNLRLYPAGTPLPAASSINYGVGQTRANNAVVSLNGLGELAVFCAQASGTTHFILDVNGYFE